MEGSSTLSTINNHTPKGSENWDYKAIFIFCIISAKKVIKAVWKSYVKNTSSQYIKLLYVCQLLQRPYGSPFRTKNTLEVTILKESLNFANNIFEVENVYMNWLQIWSYG